MPVAYEVECTRCGECFNPADENDLEHVARLDGEECGGEGVLLGSWS